MFFTMLGVRLKNEKQTSSKSQKKKIKNLFFKSYLPEPYFF